ncbi:MAG: hypothetical protein JNK79_00480 [Chitinophagaceae bacterium]|nr:hypothetical protein [Chitinophagaceae bacterium]
MNKYLLLRDNKQSGPYTVPEIIEIGIKPYDLVWLEGKSAAWRYPSEVEELKAYAPTVEEQPFDRFYKTREAILQNEKQKESESVATVAIAQHSPYEPKVSEEATPQEEYIPRKKVYINFPGNSQPAIKKPTPAPVKEVIAATTFAANTPTFEKPAERLPVQRAGKKAVEKKYFIYAAAAASVLLLGFIAVLLVNNSGQKKRLQELNTIVKQIQDKNNNITQVKNVQPAPGPEQTAETIINPELLRLNESGTPAQPADHKPSQNTAGIIPSPANNKPATETPAVVTPEGNGRPVMRRAEKSATTPGGDEEKSATANTAPTENLFKQVDIQPGRYKVGMLGGISNLTLVLTNNSNRELHKVVVQVKYLGPEKKVVNTQTVYFENVAPGAQSTIEVPKSKRGVTIDYTITDIKS